MPNPKAWLDNTAEHVYDLHAPARQGGPDAFTKFTNVLRRSNPLLPLHITGPLDTLSTRLLQYWEGVPREKVEFWELKSELLAAFCSRLKNLSLFKPLVIDPNRAMLDGIEFYMRPASRRSSETPFPYARRGERLEATESLYFLTIILSTGEDEPLVPPMPEGPVPFIPYYNPPRYLTAPKRPNAASLAVAARFFRFDERPELAQRVFRFESTAESWAWGPNLERGIAPRQAGSEGSQWQAGVLLNDEAGYRRIAGVMENSCSPHGGVSYFVLKLIGAWKEYKAVSTIPTALALKTN